MDDRKDLSIHCFSLYDTGSTSHLINYEFFYQNFPNTATEQVRTSLKFAAGQYRSEITQQAYLSFRTEGEKDVSKAFHGKFYLVPGLA